MENNKRLIAILLCMVSMIVVLNGCAGKQGTGNDGPTATVTVTGTTATSDAGGQTFTVEELKKFDGQNGSKAYVAIDGVVYDVTDNPKWPNGQHNGLTAGNDLTAAIAASPHGKGILGKLTIVGKLK